MARNRNNPGITESLRNAWKVADIRTKLIYTFMMLVLFRLVGVIPAPGVDYVAVQAAIGTQTLPLLDLVNMMTGNNFSQMTIMAMGITPYINASIIMQLLTIAIPALERMQKSGDDGRKKIAQITRYVTVGLAVFQAIGLVSSLGYVKAGWYNYVLVGISMAGGTALAMWIGERITEKGIGNGISLLIAAGIVNNLFNGYVQLGSEALAATSLTPWMTLFAVLAVSLVMIVLITWVDLGVRRINVHFAKRVSGRKMYGGTEPGHSAQAHLGWRTAADLRVLLHGVPRHDHSVGRRRKVRNRHLVGEEYVFVLFRVSGCDGVAHLRVHVLLLVHLLQPGRDRQEHPAAGRRDSLGSPRPADGGLPEAHQLETDDVRRHLPGIAGDHPGPVCQKHRASAAVWRVEPADRGLRHSGNQTAAGRASGIPQLR